MLKGLNALIRAEIAFSLIIVMTLLALSLK